MNLKIIILHVLQLLKKQKETQKQEERKRLCLYGVKFSWGWCSLLINEIVVHTVHEYK